MNKDEEYRIEAKISEKMSIKKIIADLYNTAKSNKLEITTQFIGTVLKDNELRAMLNATNVIVVGYLKYNDHGWYHSVITMRNALKILMTIKDKIRPNIARHTHGTIDDAAFVTSIAAFLHDIGNMIHRDFHWINSVEISRPIIWRYINELYSDESLEKKWLLFAHIANAIYSHDETIQAFTVEASAVKVGDGCDIAAGRSRRPYSIGKVDIHSVSALSITEVDILPGERKPLMIKVNMTNPAGVFQIEEVLMPKLRTSLLNDKTEIVTLVEGKPLRLSKSPLMR